MYEAIHNVVKKVYETTITLSFFCTEIFDVINHFFSHQIFTNLPRGADFGGSKELLDSAALAGRGFNELVRSKKTSENARSRSYIEITSVSTFLLFFLPGFIWFYDISVAAKILDNCVWFYDISQTGIILEIYCQSIVYS